MTRLSNATPTMKAPKINMPSDPKMLLDPCPPISRYDPPLAEDDSIDLTNGNDSCRHTTPRPLREEEIR